MEVDEVLAVMPLLFDAIVLSNDCFFDFLFLWPQYAKHLEKPCRKDLKIKKKHQGSFLLTLLTYTFNTDINLIIFYLSWGELVG